MDPKEKCLAHLHLVKFEYKQHDCATVHVDVEQVEDSGDDHENADDHLNDLDPGAERDAAAQLLFFLGTLPTCGCSILLLLIGLLASWLVERLRYKRVRVRARSVLLLLICHYFDAWVRKSKNYLL